MQQCRPVENIFKLLQSILDAAFYELVAGQAKSR